MMTCQDVARELHISRQRAMTIMRQQMRTINLGRSESNPRLVVTAEEFTAWAEREARVREPARMVGARRRA